ncbi:hypothetical protein [Fulvimarina sp. MAC8]|uniref:hypothetical protein n=1 Tax=Fulvimarina sp. MAC8 TaxID=3162874 RepID=UPI0032ECECAD
MITIELSTAAFALFIVAVGLPAVIFLRDRARHARMTLRLLCDFEREVDLGFEAAKVALEDNRLPAGARRTLILMLNLISHESAARKFVTYDFDRSSVGRNAREEIQKEVDYLRAYAPDLHKTVAVAMSGVFLAMATSHVDGTRVAAILAREMLEPDRVTAFMKRFFGSDRNPIDGDGQGLVPA